MLGLCTLKVFPPELYDTTLSLSVGMHAERHHVLRGTNSPTTMVPKILSPDFSGTCSFIIVGASIKGRNTYLIEKQTQSTVTRSSPQKIDNESVNSKQ